MPRQSVLAAWVAVRNNVRQLEMKKIVVGAVEITRVEESLAPSFEPAFLFPEWRPEYLEQYGWMEPHFYDRGAGQFMSSIHSWVIRTKHHLIVVDTCAGHDTIRPSFERFNLLRSSYLERLQRDRKSTRLNSSH